MSEANGKVTRQWLESRERRLPLREERVPEWDGKTVYIRMLNGLERSQLLATHPGAEDGEMSGQAAMTFMLDVLVKTLADSEGNRLFSDDEQRFAGESLGNSIMTLSNAALDHNGFGEAQGNLPGRPSGSSTTA